jgi:hypothetical protein
MEAKIRDILSSYHLHSHNLNIRIELCTLIQDAYINGHITRSFFHEAMQWIR